MMLTLQHPPLKEKVYRSIRSYIGSMPTVSNNHTWASMYKYQSPTQMDKAVSVVVSEGLSTKCAALQYGVPKSSLGDCISGWVKPGTLSDPPKYLSTEEENELARHLSWRASIGYAKLRNEVLILVQHILDSRGMQRTVSREWWESFSHCHPSLTLRTTVPFPSPVPRPQIQRCCPGALTSWTRQFEIITWREKLDKSSIWMKVECHLIQNLQKEWPYMEVLPVLQDLVTRPKWP